MLEKCREYQVPDCSVLFRMTAHILKDTFVKLNCYRSPEYKQLCLSVDSLKNWYELAIQSKNQSSYWSGWTNEDLRKDQIACITQLRKSLPETTENQAQLSNILLGAAFFRHQRLHGQYQAVNNTGFFYPLSGLRSKPEDSALFQILNDKLLCITEKNAIDPHSLFMYYDAYWVYLNQTDESGLERFKSYSYIRTHSNYLQDLKQARDEAEKSARPITAQICQVLFIKSAADALNNCQNILHNLLSNDLQLMLFERWKNKQAEVSKAAVALNSTEIIECMTCVKTSGDMKSFFEKIVENLNYEMTASSPEDFQSQYEDFQIQFRMHLQMHCQYALAGAYLLIRDTAATGLSSLLDAVIYQKTAVGINPKTRKFCYTSLNNFVELKNTFLLNYSAWFDFNRFKTCSLLKTSQSLSTNLLKQFFKRMDGCILLGIELFYFDAANEELVKITSTTKPCLQLFDLLNKMPIDSVQPAESLALSIIAAAAGPWMMTGRLSGYIKKEGVSLLQELTQDESKKSLTA